MKQKSFSALPWIGIALFCVFLALAINASGILNSSQTVLSSGKIVTVNLGVYSNSGCTKPVSSISWGSLRPGGTASFTVWVKNTGSSRVTLGLATGSWLPLNASKSMALSWNQKNAVLAPNQIVQANLTLTVSPSVSTAITYFSFNILISGTG